METESVQLSSPIDRMVRTPNGRGLMALGENGEVSLWIKEKIGKIPNGQKSSKALFGKAQWTESHLPIRSAIYDRGRAILSAQKGESDRTRIGLRLLRGDVGSPSEPSTLPDFLPATEDDISMLLAVSDLDDGYSGRNQQSQQAIIIAATSGGETWVWREQPCNGLAVSDVTTPEDRPVISLLSRYSLPTYSGKPHLVLQVDPMGWHQSVIDWKINVPLQDIITTVSKDGLLEFWRPQLGHQSYFQQGCGRVSTEEAALDVHDHPPWTRTGMVHTGKSNAIMARCSSRKKTVLSEFRSAITSQSSHPASL